MEIMTSYEKKGFEIGKKAGIKEAKIEAAKKMLTKKYDVETIQDITELSIEEIEKIKKEM